MALTLVAAAMLLALAAVPGSVRAQALMPGEVLLSNSTWNSGGAGPWLLFVQDCTSAQVAAGTCTKAGVTWNSGAAARTGAAGARVIVRQASTEIWHVQLKSTPYTFLPGVAYTLCFYARASSYENVRIGAVVDQVWSTITDKYVTFTPFWARYCVPDVQVGTTSQVFFAIDMGFARTMPFTADFDDAQVVRLDLGPARQWGTDAAINARIESVRKGDFTIRFVPPAGGNRNRLPDMTGLRATLTQHDYAVGTCMEVDSRWDRSLVTWVPETWNATVKSWYLNTVKNTFFNSIVPCTRLKW
jgi:hypothetical protein